MKGKTLFWGVGIILILGAAAILIGIALSQNDTTPATTATNPPPTKTVASQTEQTNTPAVVRINDQSISPEALKAVYARVLGTYRTHYAQTGGNLDEMLQGPEGAYYQLQIRYQASQQLINDTLILDEILQRGIVADPAVVETTYQHRYQQFLSASGLSQAGFKEIFNDPAKRRVSQQLLGFNEDTLEAFQSRLRQQIKTQLQRQLLLQQILPEVDPTSEQGQVALQQWLDKLQSNSNIVWVDPLLQAYHAETLIESGKTLKERQAYLDEAIASYETLKAQSPEDPNLNFYLARLYNLKVTWGLQLEKDLVAKAEENRGGNDDELAKLQADIARNRDLATQSVISFATVENRRQLEQLLSSDPGNPYYYYLLAKFLLDNWEEFGLKTPLRLLRTAIDRDPDYVDAHVLHGDLNMLREFYAEAIEDYQKAKEIYVTIRDSDAAYKSSDNSLETIENKLANAFLGKVQQLDRSANPPEDADVQRRQTLAQAQTLLAGLQQRVDQQEPIYVQVLGGLGDVALLQQDYEQAQQYFEDSLKLLPDKEVFYKLGRAHLLNDQLDEATDNFEAALGLDSGYAKAQLGLAQVYGAQGDLENAKVKYLMAFETGLKLTYTERRQIALEALELDPANTQMRLALADFYLARNVYEGAIKQFNTVLEQDPESIEALKGLGQVAQEKLQYQEALDDFSRALDFNPSTQERLAIYDLIYQTSRSLVGPGKPVEEKGKDALYQMAILYLNSGELTRSWQKLQLLRQRYAQFRPQEVSQLTAQLTQVVGDNLPGRPIEDQGHALIAPGTSHPAYNSAPPTSGWHYTLPASWGIHTQPLQDEIQLRNLAAGGVLVQYQPDLSSDTLKQLLELTKEVRGNTRYCRLILAPYEGLASPIVLTAWNRILALQEFDRASILVFAETFLDRGPEVSQVGCKLTQ